MASARLVAAVRSAGPMPSTITEAKAACDSWRERDNDLRFLNGPEDHLPIAAHLRWRLAEQALASPLRARNLEEVLMRQRHLVETGDSSAEPRQAVLDDLEAIMKGAV